MQSQAPPTAHQDLVLSAFDRSDPKRVPLLASALDHLGYHRFWMSEHRSPPVSASPVLLAAVAAAVTARLRVGTAGVKLRYACSRKLAEDFRVLGSLYPGRVDMGTISGAEPDAGVDAELLDGRVRAPEYFEHAFSRLLSLVAPEASGERTVPLSGRPGADVGPDPWVCSMAPSGALLAARHGVGLAYHRYLARQRGALGGADVARRYADGFQSSPFRRSPAVAVVCFGVCAETTEDAIAIWRRVVGTPVDGLGGPDFWGTEEECREQLHRIAGEYETRELVVHCAARDLTSQVEQYARLQGCADWAGGERGPSASHAAA